MFSDTIIQKTMKLYDDANKKNKKLFDRVVKFRFEGDKGEHKYKYVQDTNLNKAYAFDKNNKKIFVADVALISIHIKNFNLWCWGWALPYFHKNMTWHVKRLFEYGYNIVIKERYKIDALIKSMLITSRFIIKEQYNLDILLALTMYLTKSNGIIKEIYKKGDHELHEYYIFYGIKHLD